MTRRLVPKLPRGVRRLLRLPPTRERVMRDINDEVSFHLDMRASELRAQGLSEGEAYAEALRRFGDRSEFRDYSDRRATKNARRAGLHASLSAWWQDVRFADRQFRRAPAFTALAVLTLALGIGANTAIFTVVERLLIAPLPYADGNRIVRLELLSSGARLAQTERAQILQRWRSQARSLEAIAAVTVDALFQQQYAGPDTINAYVTANYLNLFSLRPALGRPLTEADERSDAAPVAMISYHRWQEFYGGRSDVLGHAVKVYDRNYTIVGVAAPELSIPMTLAAGASDNLRRPPPAIWLPAPLDSIGGDVMFAKLRPGISAKEAKRELEAIVGNMDANAAKRLEVRVVRPQDLLDPREARGVEILFAAVGVLLLIACANVANLLMSRGWTRRREFSVRIALGAARWRLVRLLLTESVLLALSGGALGLGVAWCTLRAVIVLRPPVLENLAEARMDSTVLVWSAGLSVLTGILFGCAPLLLTSRSVGDVLRNETRSGSEGSLARRMRSAMIVIEVALCVVLLVGAGLLARSFVALQEIPLGFDPHGLVSADIMLLLPREGRLERGAALRALILSRLRALPGVTDAVIGVMPSQEWMDGDQLETDPDASGQARSVPDFAVTFISPGFFRTARQALIEGRPPDSTTWARTLADSGVAQDVVVSQGLARRFWPQGHVVGAHMRIVNSRGGVATYVVSGVAAEVRMPGPGSPVKSVGIYQALPPQLAAQVPVLLRSTLPPAEISSTIRHVVAEVDPQSVVRTVNVGDTILGESLAPTRFAMALVGAFAATSLLLAVAGLYGVIAYSVGQRTREIGVRVAFGADPGAITRLVLSGGFRLVVAGIAIGAAVAVGATRTLTGMLYGVTSSDPLTFGVIVVLVAAVALIASYLPARRASMIDPMEALRAE